MARPEAHRGFGPLHIGMKVRFLGLSGTSFVSENGCWGPFAPFGRPLQGPSGHPEQGPFEPLHIGMKIRFLGLSGTSFVRRAACPGALQASRAGALGGDGRGGHN